MRYSSLSLFLSSLVAFFSLIGSSAALANNEPPIKSDSAAFLPNDWINEAPKQEPATIVLYIDGAAKLIKAEDTALTVGETLRQHGLNAADFKTELGTVVNPAVRLIGGNTYYFVPVVSDVSYRTEILTPPDEVTESFFLPKGDEVVLSEGEDGRALFVSEKPTDNAGTEGSVESITILSSPVPRKVMVGAIDGDRLGLTLPVAGSVTSHYGYRTHPITGVHKMHTGTDFGARCGVPIKSLTGGRVSDAGTRGGYGQQVRVDHGGGVETTYSHMSKILVSEGEMVKSGDTLGEVGSTGMSTGCHLHLEAFISGERINPYDFLVDNNLL